MKTDTDDLDLAKYDVHVDWLLRDLILAYYQARLKKRNTYNQLRFEFHLEHNLMELYRDIAMRRYTLRPGIAFVVTDPKVREIFAATFRDRVVHHLVYNYMLDYWDKRFIYDSYSCRVGKGTHFGIKRVAGFMSQVSNKYQKPAWVMKLDIVGYFMNMRQQIVWDLLQRMLADPAFRQPPEVKELLAYLLPIIIFTDPTLGVNVRGGENEWSRLLPEKSLFYAPKGQGFPIGNLTSQLFSNIYLNELDQFVKRDLHVHYYGRYVDDFVLIHPDKNFLLSCRDQIAVFLQDRLQLQLHPSKVYLQPVAHGVNFIGAKIRPWGIAPGSRISHNYAQFLHATALLDQDENWLARLASYQGHTGSYWELV